MLTDAAARVCQNVKTQHKRRKHVIHVINRYETCTAIIIWSPEAYTMSDELPLTTIMSVRFSPLISRGAYKLTYSLCVCVWLVLAHTQTHSFHPPMRRA